ncbi:putative enoyl-CoA hydratase/isomerase family protein [Patulibacter medicamentivorans]|uniref:Putative enoyl-CoA hydratase/isomerase family protein n=1 Tax=Patulibacter medicamentivorans TaxID=1097667 RepID=H0DZQ8_9ACTN|nr:enoyl-CoA hydratase/isomerase family protein [Patulibacter medicamentivorans]EHN13012.1 putative enoyl-CoA hydratase/isomerase family protein [Patulibacter medicamentivorans]
MPQLRRDGDVFVLDLGEGENRFAPDWVAGVEDALAEATAAPAPRALVTAATGKFWSNGLDLEWMAGAQDQVPAFLTRVHELFARVLEAGIPTVAAVQGHAFAAGAMLATAHDVVVMREDRGYFCVPEVDLGLPFTPGMSALLLARLPRRTAHDAMTTGRRYTGPEAVAAGIADAVAPADELLERAVGIAAARAGKQAGTLHAIKRGIHGPALEALRGPHGFGAAAA